MQLCYKIDACLCYRVCEKEGHKLMNIKKVLIFSAMGLILWAAWGMEANAERIMLEDWKSIEAAQHRLVSVPKESYDIYVTYEGLNVKEMARLVRQCWDVNHDRNQYSVSLFDATEQTDDPGVLVPFFDLFGEETSEIMRQAAVKEDSCVNFIRLERVDGLDICSFAVRGSEREQYHVMVKGEWKDWEIPFQHLVIPSTGIPTDHSYLSEFNSYRIDRDDINFDGHEDLLIREGFSSGSGGSWGDYRAVVWDEDAEEFVWFPSFPRQVSSLELTEKRVIDRYQVGAGYEVVCEYGVVDGEYVETRKLINEYHMTTKTDILSYYEMGTLVKEYDVTNMSMDEMAALYPDLDYWWRG